MAAKQTKDRRVLITPETMRLFTPTDDGYFKCTVWGDPNEDWRKHKGYFVPGRFDINDGLIIIDDDDVDEVVGQNDENTHAHQIRAINDLKDVKSAKKAPCVPMRFNVYTMEPEIVHFLVALQNDPPQFDAVVQYIVANNTVSLFEAAQDYVRANCPQYQHMNFPTTVSSEICKKFSIYLKTRCLFQKAPPRPQTIIAHPISYGQDQSVASMPPLEEDDSDSDEVTESESRNDCVDDAKSTTSKSVQQIASKVNQSSKVTASLRRARGAKRVSSRPNNRKQQPLAAIVSDDSSSSESSSSSSEEVGPKLAWSDEVDYDCTKILYVPSKETKVVQLAHNLQSLSSKSSGGYKVCDSDSDFVKHLADNDNIGILVVDAAITETTLAQLYTNTFCGNKVLWHQCVINGVYFVTAESLQGIVDIQLLQSKQADKDKWNYEASLKTSSLVALINHILPKSFAPKTIPNLMGLTIDEQTSLIHGLFLKKGELWDVGEFDEDDRVKMGEQDIANLEFMEFDVYFETVKKMQPKRCTKDTNRYNRMKRTKMKEMTMLKDDEYCPNVSAALNDENTVKEKRQRKKGSTAKQKKQQKRARGRPTKEPTPAPRRLDNASNSVTDYDPTDFKKMLQLGNEVAKINLRPIAKAAYKVSIELEPTVGKYLFPIDSMQYPGLLKADKTQRDWATVATHFREPKDICGKLKELLDKLKSYPFIFELFHQMSVKLGASCVSLEDALKKHGLSRANDAEKERDYTQVPMLFPNQTIMRHLVNRRPIPSDIRMDAPVPSNAATQKSASIKLTRKSVPSAPSKKMTILPASAQNILTVSHATDLIKIMYLAKGGEYYKCFQISIPRQLRQQLKMKLAYTFEEELSEEVETKMREFVKLFSSSSLAALKKKKVYKEIWELFDLDLAE